MMQLVDKNHTESAFQKKAVFQIETKTKKDSKWINIFEN